MSAKKAINKSVKNKKKKTISISNLLLIPLIIVLFIFLIKSIFYQINVLAKQEKDLKYYISEKEKLARENIELQEKAKKINSNEYIEDVARKKLDMYYSNEKVYLDYNKINEDK